MARPLRVERTGGWYHVTARGNERKVIYRDDSDRRHFLALLEEMTDRFRLVTKAKGRVCREVGGVKSQLATNRSGLVS